MAPPGRTARRRGAERKPREERWSELVKVATQVFYEKGYEAASLQDIADRLGMLKGSLYYYIQTKEDLLYEVINGVHQGGLRNLKRSEEHTSELQSRENLVCRLLLEKKKK